MNISTSQNSIKDHGNRFNSWVYLGVKTCEVFLSFVAIIFLGSIVVDFSVAYLYSLFYVTREFHRFLQRGWAKQFVRMQI